MRFDDEFYKRIVAATFKQVKLAIDATGVPAHQFNVLYTATMDAIHHLPLIDDKLDTAMETAAVVAHASAPASPAPAEPRNHREAISSPEAPQWRSAEKEEIEAHERNQTWTLVPRSSVPAAQVLGGRWVYKRKLDVHGQMARYKARWVA